MSTFRRDFLKLAGGSLAGAAAATVAAPGAQAQTASSSAAGAGFRFDVKHYGATGDGHTIDTPAINRAIEAASAGGGGTICFPAGTYACYSIHLKSNIVLSLDPGATILAADGTGYDMAESNAPWEKYQDFGHNHWHNSLIWGVGLENIAIVGTGLIWGKGLSRGGHQLPYSTTPGAGNKAIGLKNCHNVVLRDFSILHGGHFGILATGVDNFTVDNLKIDTNQDGMDIDCCRNVRITNCSVNSPWDDGICLKSSFALGYSRATENVTIANCYVTGAYQLGTMLDGTWKLWPAGSEIGPCGRIKCGTESVGGFKGITISNCVFDSCHGFALESADGAALEDITFTGITMRNCNNTPIFLRLCSRMRGPAGRPVGSLKRIIIGNVVSYNSYSTFGRHTEIAHAASSYKMVSRFGGGGLISGIPDHPIEDIKIHDLYMEHVGGGSKAMAEHVPPELEKGYPEPNRFGDIPASGFYVRHVKNIEFTNVEVAWSQPDARPVFSLNDVDGASFFRVRTPKKLSTPVFSLNKVEDLSVLACSNVKDNHLESVAVPTL